MWIAVSPYHFPIAIKEPLLIDYSEPPAPEVVWTPYTRILYGLDEIARYLRVHKRTVWRWVHEIGLPAMQTPKGTWITTPTLIDLWILSCNRLQVGSKRKGSATDSPPNNTEEEDG